MFDVNGNQLSFLTYGDYDDPDSKFNNPDLKEILAMVQRDGSVEYHKVTPDQQQAIAKTIYQELKKGHPNPVGEGVSEAMKPSDVPPSMRDRLTMRDIERERPEGAFRFRVTFDDGSHTDFMDFESARASADIEQGRISRLSETQAQHGRKAHSGKRSTARIDRILQLLRARNPQAQNDLEALILDFRGQQAMDRRDISRLDAENDAEEEDIARLEKMLAILKQRAKLAEYGSKKKGPGLRVSRDQDENIVMAEAERDACYRKVKSRYKVWPSAYASGALVQCRKQGAANWGTGGSKK
jgi:hypothetical protein